MARSGHAAESLDYGWVSAPRAMGNLEQMIVQLVDSIFRRLCYSKHRREQKGFKLFSFSFFSCGSPEVRKRMSAARSASMANNAVDMPTKRADSFAEVCFEEPSVGHAKPFRCPLSVVRQCGFERFQP